MSERDCEKFPVDASYLPDVILRRVMEYAEKESCPVVWLVLWLGLWTGATLQDILRITAYEAWQGKIVIWDAWAKCYRLCDICEEPKRLVRLREAIAKREIINMDELIFMWFGKEKIDQMICDVCVKAGVSRKIRGYSSVVRSEKARHDKQIREMKKAREKKRKARKGVRMRKPNGNTA